MSYLDAERIVDLVLSLKRIEEIMSPPVFCLPGNSVVDVAAAMARNQVGVVAVVDNKNKLVGIISSGELVNKIICRNVRSYETFTAEMIMEKEFIKITPDMPVIRALLAAAQSETRDFMVVNKDKLIGVVTPRDLIRNGSTFILLMLKEMESKETFADLARVGQKIDYLLEAMVAKNIPLPDIMDLVTEFHDRLTCRVIQICEKEMMEKGYGASPVDYCWLHMGSPGRREQTLRTDQDNAIIYNDPPAGQNDAVKDYFLTMAALIVNGLEQCGFAKCSGNVMALNPQWCMSISDWRKTVSLWSKYTYRDPKYVRNLTIFLDYRPIYGNKTLANELRNFIFQVFGGNNTAIILMIQDDLLARIPLGIWGRLVTEKTGSHRGEINLKNGACIHIQNCVRVYAIKDGLYSTATLKRLHDLEQRNTISSHDASTIKAAFETLMMFRIRENLNKVKLGKKPDNYIKPEQLTRSERTILKYALVEAARFQKMTGSIFNIAWVRANHHSREKDSVDYV